MQTASPARRNRGFTLIELMVVVVIGAILLGIAVPSYMSQVRQSRRTEAKTALLDLAGREERFYSVAINPATGPAYSQLPNDLGYNAAGWPVPIGSTGTNYYQVTVCVPAAANCAGAGLTMPAGPPPAPSYVVVATPLASQVKDTLCRTLAVDSVGQQYATGTSGAQYCWGN